MKKVFSEKGSQEFYVKATQLLEASSTSGRNGSGNYKHKKGIFPGNNVYFTQAKLENCIKSAYEKSTKMSSVYH